MTIVEARVRVEQVVVVPRNGLANRLQAWASAAILAAEWDVPLKVVWETEPAMPATAADLFAARVVERFFTDPDLVTSLAGAPHAELPRYLSRSGQALVLAGHDRGEQVFMVELMKRVRASRTEVNVVIIAGGNFHVPESTDPEHRRGLFYRELTWSDTVMRRVLECHEAFDQYVALHIRQTDRSLEAPTSRAIRRALGELRQFLPERSLFIAADTAVGQERWAREALSLGFIPWSLPRITRQRSRVEGAIDAAADWVLLSRAQASVHAAASTFSVEAAIASGRPERSIPLAAKASTQRFRSAVKLAHSMVRYPQRHWLQSD